MSHQELGVWFVSVWLAFGASWAIAKRLNALIRMLATIRLVMITHRALMGESADRMQAAKDAAR